jgi:quinol-cytochrome oxidoreductase complex cytochrome b subunit
MAEAMPLVGEKVKFLLLGGHSIDENALTRFYVLHTVLLPLTMAIGISVHVWRVRKDGGIYLPLSEKRR